MVATLDMRALVDVECECKLAVTLKASALFGAWEHLATIALASLRSTALHLLFLGLTSTRNVDLALAWLLLFAWVRCVAGVLIRVVAEFLRLPTRLLAWLATGIFAFSWSMAWFPTSMRSTFERLATDFATADVLKPALLIFESLLTAHAALLDQERALRASFIILVAIVRNLRVATSF